jgi:hypothetical protein
MHTENVRLHALEMVLINFYQYWPVLFWQHLRVNIWENSEGSITYEFSIYYFIFYTKLYSLFLAFKGETFPTHFAKLRVRLFSAMSVCTLYSNYKR